MSLSKSLTPKQSSQSVRPNSLPSPPVFDGYVFTDYYQNRLVSVQSVAVGRASEPGYWAISLKVNRDFAEVFNSGVKQSPGRQSTFNVPGTVYPAHGAGTVWDSYIYGDIVDKDGQIWYSSDYPNYTFVGEFIEG